MITVEGQERDLFASVATYTAPTTVVSLRFLRSAFERLIQPYIDSAKVEFTLDWCRPNSQSFHPSPVTPENWKRVPTDVPLEWICLSGWKEEYHGTEISPSIVGISIGFSQHKSKVSTLEFSANKEIFGNTIPRAVQEQIVAWTMSAFVELAGIVGYITTDFVAADVYGSLSPYERAVGLSYPWASREFRTKTRGYYWGNFLHKEHLDTLSGTDNLQNAPVSLIKDIGNSGYYLQLTDDINYIDRDKLSQLKDFFSPLLPKGAPLPPRSVEALPDFIL